MSRVDTFLENAADGGSEVFRTIPRELPRVLADVLTREDPGEWMYAPDPEGRLVEMAGHSLLAGWRCLPAPPAGSCARFAQRATACELGVVVARAGLVSHGSVLIRPDRAKEGAVSLMPPATVTVVRAGTLYPDSESLFQHLGRTVREEPASWIFVTGPSSTADLGDLVQGVHGPGRTYVIVLEEAAA